MPVLPAFPAAAAAAAAAVGLLGSEAQKQELLGDMANFRCGGAMRCAVLRSPRPACLLLKADCDPLLLLLSTLSIDHLPRPAAGALHQWLLLLLLQEGGVLGADRARQRLRCQRAH